VLQLLRPECEVTLGAYGDAGQLQLLPAVQAVQAVQP
jgi:hypothetical protein